METPQRSLAKALSWRLIATLITAGAAWAITGTFAFAAAIAGLDTAIKFAMYFAHERAWNRITYGRNDAAPTSEPVGVPGAAPTAPAPALASNLDPTPVHESRLQ